MCSVLLCFSVRKRTLGSRVWSFIFHEGYFFSHRTHRCNRPHLRTVSIPQNASGIQSSQSVTAIFNTNKGQRKAYILLIGVSRRSLPFPSGEGSGEGPAGEESVGPAGEGGGAIIFLPFVCSVHLCYSVRRSTHPLNENTER